MKNTHLHTHRNNTGGKKQKGRLTATILGYRLVDIKDISQVANTSKGISMRGDNITTRTEPKKYRIDIGAYGSIAIEAPTKEECLDLFKEVTKTKRDSKIDEAIR